MGKGSHIHFNINQHLCFHNSVSNTVDRGRWPCNLLRPGRSLVGVFMKSLIDKKYIFARKLDGKPIEIDIITTENRLRYVETRKLFYETGVFRDIGCDDHGRNTELTHEIHFTRTRYGKPYINIVDPRRFYNDAEAIDNMHFLP